MVGHAHGVYTLKRPGGKHVCLWPPAAEWPPRGLAIHSVTGQVVRTAPGPDHNCAAHATFTGADESKMHCAICGVSLIAKGTDHA